jgi:hypothetical protein
MCSRIDIVCEPASSAFCSCEGFTGGREEVRASASEVRRVETAITSPGPDRIQQLRTV